MEATDQQLANLLKYIDPKKGCYDFLSECTSTLDQASKSTRPFPLNLPYLPVLIESVLTNTLIAVVKHRRLFVSWGIVCGISLWDAMFHTSVACYIISSKEEKSDELVRRCKFMYDSVPSDKMGVKPKAIYKYTELRFPELDSVIKGIPEGADQLRQYGCTRIMGDEFPTWPHARETYEAMRPTIEGGGSICLVGTRYPGFFQDIVNDTIDNRSIEGVTS